MPSFNTLDELQKTEKPVFLRVDLNVPLKNGKIVDGTRVERLLPTLQKLLQRTKIIVLATHLGRPEPIDDFSEDHPLSTSILVPELEKHFKNQVYFLNTCVDYEKDLKNPGIYVLQNLRFYEGEEKNDNVFAKGLLGPCEFYINDAFSCSHRAHASVCAITQFVKSFQGLLMEDELKHLLPIVQNPKKPFMAIVGGSKVSTKIKVLENLLSKVDFLVIGGAMANTFLKAKGGDIGKSLYEESFLDFCKTLLKKDINNKIILPIDFKVGNALQDESPKNIPLGESINGMILDFGEASVEMILKNLAVCSSVVWNGPVGAYEYTPYDGGSLDIAKKIAKLTKNGFLTSVAGGGDTLALLQKADEMTHFSYTSTAGGAFLELLEGRHLPGIDALRT